MSGYKQTSFLFKTITFFEQKRMLLHSSYIKQLLGFSVEIHNLIKQKPEFE